MIGFQMAAFKILGTRYPKKDLLPSLKYRKYHCQSQGHRNQKWRSRSWICLLLANLGTTRLSLVNVKPT